MRRLRRWTVRAAGVVALGALSLWLIVISTPFPEGALDPQPTEGRRLFDRHGRLLRDAPGDRPDGSTDARGRWQPLAALGPWIGPAFIAIEDRRFHEHSGVDLRGIARAAWSNLKAGRVVAGGSTITQQVVQLTLPQPRTFWGKAKEAVWALRLERARDKTAILTQYVNRAPFGHGATGIEAAAQLYFRRPTTALTLAQAALLAGIPLAPSRLNPFTDLAAALDRQRAVLRRMQTTGAIDANQLAEALAEPIVVVEPRHVFAAPHFTSWALRPSATNAAPRDTVTTLDLDVQRVVKDAVASTLPPLADKGVGQAAVVVLDTRTGDVLAWLGSADFFAGPDGQVDMVVGRRQPGSTLKPFVYGLGIEQGFTAASALPDLPLFFPTGLGGYRPRNYDRRFHGWVRLRTALANSYNVPAVWMAHAIGPGALLERLAAVGFASLTRSVEFYGLGLALGNGEVQLIELANAYRVLANGGQFTPWRWRLDTPLPQPKRVMPAAVAHLLTDILSDGPARAPAFGGGGPLRTPYPAAVKTGTSTDFTDNWTVGYTAALTVAVWTGNFDGAPMEGVSGVTGAAPIWRRILDALRAHYPPRAFETVGLTRRTIALDDDGGRPYAEWFITDVAAVTIRTSGAKLRVTFPADGDRFGADADTPPEFARLKLRAQAPEAVDAVVFEIDGIAGDPVSRPFEQWWPLVPGAHQLRIWAASEPAAASQIVRFRVDARP